MGENDEYNDDDDDDFGGDDDNAVDDTDIDNMMLFLIYLYNSDMLCLK